MNESDRRAGELYSYQYCDSNGCPQNIDCPVNIARQNITDKGKLSSALMALYVNAQRILFSRSRNQYIKEGDLQVAKMDCNATDSNTFNSNSRGFLEVVSVHTLGND